MEVDVFEAAEGVRRPLRLSFGGGTARGEDGRLTRGRGTEGLGPTDLLKLTGGARAGVVGTAKVLADADVDLRVMYLLLFMGTKIPDPGTEVVKYFRPSTSPLFFPRCACSALSSTPANRPGLPATDPKYLTVPYMPPGTFTRSPTCNSSRGAIMDAKFRTFHGSIRRESVICRSGPEEGEAWREGQEIKVRSGAQP